MNNNLSASSPINNPILGPNLQSLNGISFTQGLLRAGITMTLIVGTIIFLFNLLIGGVSYISSGGDKGKTEAAKQKITNALIGLVVMFSVFAVAALMSRFLGVDLLFFSLDAIQIK